MYKVRECEDAVKKLDIPNMREISRKYKERPKDVVLSSRDIKIFLIEYILRWSDSKSIVPITNWIWTYYKRSKTTLTI